MEETKEKKSRPWIFPLLFLLTLITTTIAGAEWMYGRPLMYFEPALSFGEVLSGLEFSLPFLAILTVHEFGHYLTARYYQVKVTLPYYIPLWLGFAGIPLTIGTMGAFIRIKEPIKSRLEYFDIGIAGPLAGFIIALFVLHYGFTHLPPADHIYTIHPEYEEYGADYADHFYNDENSFYLGDNLTFWFFRNYVAPDPSLVPNAYEIIHYPWLFAGFLALFFTALNLLPIGQLDGGHALYGLFGLEKHSKISTVMFILLLFYAGLGLVTPFDPLEDLLLYIPLYIGFLFIVMRSMRVTNRTRLLLASAIFTAQFITVLFFPALKGYTGWLVFAFIIGRFLGVYHPPALMDQPLSPPRKVLGWITLIVFVISFSPRPFVIY
ncbi:MAG: site-2 protease family protein [Cyclobacteriaceae bacterium]|nr:site-2 protease family protein [Cyclobacteriaceae bacterium]